MLTGETGAGKSILLDAFALALGARGDAALVRHGAGAGAGDGGVRRAGQASGARAARRERHRGRGRADPAPRAARRRRTRAFINDQPVSVQALQSLGAALVEIHGQHDERALVDAATHRALLDAFAGLEGEAGDGRAAVG